MQLYVFAYLKPIHSYLENNFKDKLKYSLDIFILNIKD